MQRFFPLFVSLFCLSFYACNQASTKISPYEYAVMSADAYQADYVKELPPDWEFMFDFSALKTKDTFSLSRLAGIVGNAIKGKEGWMEETASMTYNIFSQGGYYARAYYNPKKQRIVIAHRGTDAPHSLYGDFSFGKFFSEAFTMLRDIDDDADIFSGDVPKEQYDMARKFVKAVRDTCHARYGKQHKISHTGHSLGAVLAELCAIKDSTEAVTFDSPGALPMARKLLNYNGLDPLPVDITTYNASPNAINTANEPIGRVFRLYPPLPDEPGWFLGDYDRQLSSYVPYSLQQHEMVGILTQFDPKTGQPKVYSEQTGRWPSSDESGLGGISQYSDYANHPFWWDKMLEGRYNAKEKRAFIEDALQGIFSNTEAKKGITIVGDASDNHLFGATNYSDSLLAGAGNDILMGFGGEDLLEGGSGEDEYHFWSDHHCNHLIRDDDGLLYIDKQKLLGTATGQGNHYTMRHAEKTLELEKSGTKLTIRSDNMIITIPNFRSGKFGLSLE